MGQLPVITASPARIIVLGLLLGAMTDVATEPETAELLRLVREIHETLEEFRPAMEAARKILDNPAMKWRRRDRSGA
jgi:hypothetical protein